MPLAYTEWLLKRVPEPGLEAICAGISERRKGSGLPKVTVQVEGQAHSERVWSEHVRVVHTPEWPEVSTVGY